jgi:hypothetical protein
MLVSDEDFEFSGFSTPNYTPVPDELFDQLLPKLSGAELKVLLYVIRRTFGFKKAADSISFNQICDGITTSDGRVLDHGTGLSKSTAQLALKGLVKKRIVLATKRVSRERGNEPTTYRLNLITFPYDENRHSPIPKTGPALYRESAPQETVSQETGGTTNSFDDSTDSTGPGPREKVVKDTLDMSSVPAVPPPDGSPPQPLSLAALRAWDERVAQQERHLRGLKGGPPRD